MYDPTRDEYHIFYQAFPQHINGGNKTWGHAKSKDMITWTDVGGWENRSFVAVEPSPYAVPSYDWLGVFSGGAFSTNLRGEQDGNLTLMYTGNVIVPDNWKVPYVLGPATGTPYATEQQAIATSSDGGLTWQKWEGNPWLNGQPAGWNTTGLRDPVFAPNTALDKILEKDSPHWYLVMGSGIRDVGPRIPLFSAKATDLTRWDFEGALWEVPLNYSFGGDRFKTGNYGGNYEVASVWDTVEKTEHGGDGTTQHWITCLGSEGYNDERHPWDKWSLFTLGDMVRRDNGSAEFQIKASGVLDWGNAYALNTFFDAKNDRRVVWGWSQEDFSNALGWAQGGVSSLTIPQEVYVMKVNHVRPPKGGVVEGSAIWTKNEDSDETYSFTTVGQKPLPEVVAGIQGQQETLIGTPITVDGYQSLGVNSSRLHIQAVVSKIPDAVEGNFVGLQFRQSPNGEEFTEITYQPATDIVYLDRRNSSLLPYAGKVDWRAHFEPLVYANGTTESLTFDLFIDGSLMEVFINNRFALTNRIYPSRPDALGAGLIASGGAVFERVDYWPMEKNVWPERPLNASSTLLFDKFYENHITFDNPYVPTGLQIYDGN
jgi:beta-fructofuranosidase